MRNYCSQNSQGRLSPSRETAALLPACWRSTDSLVRRQNLTGISLFKGGIRAKSSEEHWNGTSGILVHHAEISTVFLSQHICFISSISQAWEHRVTLKLTRTALSAKASLSKREKQADDLLTTQINSFCYPGPWNSAKFQHQQNHLKFPFNLKLRFPALLWWQLMERHCWKKRCSERPSKVLFAGKRS